MSCELLPIERDVSRRRDVVEATGSPPSGVAGSGTFAPGQCYRLHEQQPWPGSFDQD